MPATIKKPAPIQPFAPVANAPPWFTKLIFRIEDSISLAALPSLTARYAALTTRWQTLNETDWRHIQLRFLDAALDIVEPHDTHDVVLPVRVLIARELRGDIPLTTEWHAVIDAATFAPGPLTPAKEAAIAACIFDPSTAASAAANTAGHYGIGNSLLWDHLTDALFTALLFEQSSE